MKRAIVIVLDGFGCGEAPDAYEYQDQGSNTLEGIYNNTSLNIPNMKKMGLYNIDGVNIPEKEEYTSGSYGKLQEQSKGKNSPVGHWELMGFVKEVAFKTYYDGFPKELLFDIAMRSGIDGFICNKKGSGTDFLKEYGTEMMITKNPIIYTSADSVLQIAAHEDIMSVENLYKVCQNARNIIDEKGYGIGTVIARPFVGDSPENFKRTYNRKDFEATDFGRTMLDVLAENGKSTLGIGKIEDLFAGRNVTRAIHTHGNEEGIDLTIDAIKNSNEDFIFTNLVDYDMLYGHRNDIEGYARALEYFDQKLPEIYAALRDDDVLVLTADHGNDPSTPSTDHSREYVPCLVYGKEIKENTNLGTRWSFADLAATLLELYGLPLIGTGGSFTDIVKKG